MCDEHYFDGGECLECGERKPCELCDENEWDTRCDVCDGGRICEDCYVECEICGFKVCSVCQREGHIHEQCYLCKTMIDDDYISCSHCNENVICEECHGESIDFTCKTCVSQIDK